MKKWIYADSTSNRQLTITMYIRDANELQLAASDYLDHLKSIKKKYRISDEHLKMLNDIIASFDHNIQVAGFKITNRRKASNSYSYYITFIPITDEGEKLLPIDLIFRVSSHNSESAEASADSSFARIVTFALEHEDFNKASELIYEGVQILKELKKGNVDILDQL